MLNNKWLITFNILARTKSFTRTAELLFMTQPGVTQHLKKLEAQCGQVLVRREHKQFELTVAGEQMHHYVQHVVADQQSFLENLGEDNPNEGRIRLSCSGAFAVSNYHDFLRFQTQHPGFIVEIEVAPQQRVLQSITKGSADFGVVGEFIDEPHIGAIELSASALVLVVAKSVADNISDVASLTHLGAVHHPDLATFFTMFKQTPKNNEWAKVNLDDVPRVGYINQLQQILAPVAQGLGWTILPIEVIETSPLAEQLHIHQAFEAVHQKQFLIYRKGRTWPSRFNTFLSLLGHGL